LKKGKASPGSKQPGERTREGAFVRRVYPTREGNAGKKGESGVLWVDLEERRAAPCKAINEGEGGSRRRWATGAGTEDI